MMITDAVSGIHIYSAVSIIVKHVARSIYAISLYACIYKLDLPVFMVKMVKAALSFTCVHGLTVGCQLCSQSNNQSQDF